MANLIIPTPTDLGAYTFEVELDSRIYRMAMQFNDREGFWYMTISDESGTVLRSGVKVVVNWPLAGRAVEQMMPPGTLYAIDPTDADTEPGLTDLGDTVLLTYAEES